tara:strand:+ start:76 stop:843 length:768 start_codon:yes stop_codon:yes gene_type:complete
MNEETVLEIEHYTDDLFWFKTTKGENWNKKNFQPGEFTMIGMPGVDVTRAYSIANSPDDDCLEFLSIKVQDGPLTSKLQHINVGDIVTVSHKAIGTLLLRNLDPEPCINGNGRLWMISTGTGLAPFLSLARHPEVYEYYEQVIITHTCRNNDELVFREQLEEHGATVYQSVTREEPREGVYTGRITDNIRSGILFDQLGLDISQFDKSRDRIMICGGPSFNNEIRDMLEEQGWMHGTMRSPGDFVQERAFVETIE